jgi:5-methyltetrahydrofolate--homocysteine methyltransferase
MEAIVGCPVIADHGTGSARSQPVSHDPADRVPASLVGDPWSELARAFLVALADESRGSFPLGTTLMRGFSDLLAALYGSPDFFYHLVDEPAKMDPLIDRICDLWIAFAETQLEVIPDFHGGVGSYFYNLWLPGRGCVLQEDASALLSPSLFERFLVPAIERVASVFDTTMIHLHPGAFIPVDQLIKTKLTAIELHIDLGGVSAEELLPVYRRIQERKPLMIWGDLTDQDVAILADQLDPQALAVNAVVHDRAQAERYWKRLKG